MSLKKLLLIAFAALVLFSQGYSLVSGVSTAGAQVTETLGDLDLEEIVPSDPFLPSITQRCAQKANNVLCQILCISLFLAYCLSVALNEKRHRHSTYLLFKKRRYRPLWLERQRILL